MYLAVLLPVRTSLELLQSARWLPQHPFPGLGQLSSLPQHGLPPPSAVVSARRSPVLSRLLLLFLAVLFGALALCSPCIV
jgi:hypothetical protein